MCLKEIYVLKKNKIKSNTVDMEKIGDRRVPGFYAIVLRWFQFMFFQFNVVCFYFEFAFVNVSF